MIRKRLMKKFNKEVSIHWYRRDLRCFDNHSLYIALQRDLPVVPVFIFDKNILDLLPAGDARVTFIHRELVALQQQWKDHGSDLQVYYGEPEEVWHTILQSFEVKKVYANRDYEPYAAERDSRVAALLAERGITLELFKDHVLMEPREVLKSDGLPYTVFTPYSRRWRTTWTGEEPAMRSQVDVSFPSENLLNRGAAFLADPMPDLEMMGFHAYEGNLPERIVPEERIRHYGERRDYPALPGTSRLGVHLRFGTISIRELARQALRWNDTFLNELIWRDFYQQILAHFPRVVDGAFKPAYDRIEWRNHPEEFAAWCAGQTGYPIVDAGMRELNATGYMHNRVRMITASFLTKHLLIDWRWGEAWFAEKLLDFELASNNGGWQWAAGCGTDAAPYFRVFNPYAQQEKFDKNLEYVRQWVPEFGSAAYPPPIVDHAFARQRCLDTYKRALG
jgi:deoxyribodipyrimidine photo-lyase